MLKIDMLLMQSAPRFATFCDLVIWHCRTVSLTGRVELSRALGHLTRSQTLLPNFYTRRVAFPVEVTNAKPKSDTGRRCRNRITTAEDAKSAEIGSAHRRKEFALVVRTF